MLLKERIFMGLKRSDVSVHVITTGEGIPVEFLVTTGSVPDNTSLQVMNIDLPKMEIYMVMPLT